MKKKDGLRIALYLQTFLEDRTDKAFNEIIKKVKKSNVDILVFPEQCYTPFNDKMKDIYDERNKNRIVVQCEKLSKTIGIPVIVSVEDWNGVIFSLYVNAFARKRETNQALYIKHTKTQNSIMDREDYRETYQNYFQPIILGNHHIGMTICHDCTQSVFSRVYGLRGVDIIINSTGGGVVYDKWYRYNQARAIENKCHVFVTMGWNDGSCSCVLGFTPGGKILKPDVLYEYGNEGVTKHGMPGGIYVYDTQNEGKYQNIETEETPNKNKSELFQISKQDPLSILQKAKPISSQVYVRKSGDKNIVICLVKGNDIMKPEKVLSLLYAEKLKAFENKKYLIINQHTKIAEKFYEEQLSPILRVRAMENFCAVLVTSANITDCYQCGDCKTSQKLATIRGCYKIDLRRAGGPESIWRNETHPLRDKNEMKVGILRLMRKEWRENVEFLIKELVAKSRRKKA